MFKKIILAAGLLTTFAGLTITTATQAETVSTVKELETTNLSALSQSLNSLTATMNQTVTNVAEQKVKKVQTHSSKVLTNSEKIVNTANKYLGVPYVWGGTTPTGFDCSGLTSYVYREALGKEIGRTTYDQIASGKSISADQAKVGDILVFFGGSHVGVYIGNGQFIHAPQSGEIVQVTSLSIMQADFALEF